MSEYSLYSTLIQDRLAATDPESRSKGNDGKKPSSQVQHSLVSVAHTCKPSTGKGEAGKPGVRGHPWLHSKAVGPSGLQETVSKQNHSKGMCCSVWIHLCDYLG